MVKLILRKYIDNNGVITTDDFVISGNYVYGLSRSHKHFSDRDNFSLGAMPSMSVVVKAAKESGVQAKLEDGYTTLLLQEETSPNTFTTQYMLNLDSVDDKDLYFVEMTFADSMVKLNFKYDASEIITQSADGYVTLIDIVRDICSKAEIEWSNSTQTDLQAYNGNFSTMKVSWYDNTISARDYVSYIAELNGGYAKIDADGHLRFPRYATISSYTISTNVCSSFLIGEQKTPATKVLYQLGASTEYVGTEGADAKDTLYVNSNNVFITNGTLADDTEFSITDQLEFIRTAISGLSFYSITVDKLVVPELARAGDIVQFTNGNDSYNAIWEVEQTFNGVWRGGLASSFATGTQQETSSKAVPSVIRGIYLNIDRDMNELTVLVNENKLDADGKIQSLSSQIRINEENIETEVSKLQQLNNALYGDGVKLKEFTITNSEIDTQNQQIVKVLGLAQQLQGNETLFFQCDEFITTEVEPTVQEESGQQPTIFWFYDDGFVYDGIYLEYNLNTDTLLLWPADPTFDLTQFRGQTIVIYKGHLGSLQQLSTKITQTERSVLITVNDSIQSALANNEDLINMRKTFKFAAEGFIIMSDNSKFQAVYNNDGMRFDYDGNKIVWIDAQSASMGVSELLIGDAQAAISDNTNRWRVYSSSNGEHLRFTRHG